MKLKGLARDSKRFSVFILSEDRPIPLSDCPPCTGTKTGKKFNLHQLFKPFKKIFTCQCVLTPEHRSRKSPVLVFEFTVIKRKEIKGVKRRWETSFSHLMDLICPILHGYLIEGLDASGPDFNIPVRIKCPWSDPKRCKWVLLQAFQNLLYAMKRYTIVRT